MRKILAVVILMTLAVVALLWFRQNRVEVYFPFSGRVTDASKVVHGARTFKGSSGHVLLTLPEESSAPFIYLPEYQQVLSCNSKTFMNLWLIGLQKRDRTGSYPCAGSGKQEVKQNIVSTGTSLAFTSWRNGAETRFSVTW